MQPELLLDVIRNATLAEADEVGDGLAFPSNTGKAKRFCGLDKSSTAVFNDLAMSLNEGIIKIIAILEHCLDSQWRTLRRHT